MSTTANPDGLYYVMDVESNDTTGEDLRTSIDAGRVIGVVSEECGGIFSYVLSQPVALALSTLLERLAEIDEQDPRELYDRSEALLVIESAYANFRHILEA